MPSIKELYKRLDDVRIDADSINLNTDGLESLLATTQADIALIKADLANGVLVNGTISTVYAIADGDGNTFGLDRNFPVDVQNQVTVYPQQGSTVSNSNFTSITSAELAPASASREVLSVYNEGAGTLFINVGSSCSTTSYQIRLFSGDYWEAPAGQQSLQHSGIFGSSGTARVAQIS
jgi:hypothetical protein